MLDNGMSSEVVKQSLSQPEETEFSTGSCQHVRKSKLHLCEEEVVSLAALLAISLGGGKTKRDLQTLVNLFSLTTDNLRAMLTQRAVNQGDEVEIID